MIMDRLQKLGRREQIGLFAGGLILVVWLADLLVVAPIAGRLAEMNRRIGAEADKLRYNRQVIRTRDQVEARFSRIQDLVGRVRSPAEAIDDLNREVDGIAARSTVNLDQTEAGGPRPGEACQEYFVEVRQFQTNIRNLLTFMHEVQRAGGMLRITRLNVSPDKGNGNVKGSMTITKVMLPPDA